jgi:hypothetical protein
MLEPSECTEMILRTIPIVSRYIIAIESMTTNLGSAITHKVRKDYSKFNMVRNEPVQTHFTAEGVQVYSLADIEALKMIAERKMKGMPEGDFVRPK